MPEELKTQSPPKVKVIADVESNAKMLLERVIQPAGFYSLAANTDGPQADVLLVDITQLRGDPLQNLRDERAAGEEAPAIILAARFPHNHLRDLLRLNVTDFLIKPYRVEELCQSIKDLAEARSPLTNSKILSRRVEGLREDLRTRSDELRMISEIGRVVVRLGDLDAILRRIVEASAYLTGAEEASIYLLDRRSNELTLRALKQAGERHAALKQLRSEDSLAGEVLKTGEPLLRTADSSTEPVKIQTGFLVQSLIKVPIRVEKRIVGVLGVYNSPTAKPFNEHHVSILLAIADWTGVALEQTRLMRKAQSSVQESELTLAAPPKLIDGLDDAIETLITMANSPAEGLSPSALGKLQALLQHMQNLRAQPLAAMSQARAQNLMDVEAIIQKLADEHRLSAVRHGLDLQVETGRPLPLFEGDGSRTKYVLEALIAAAIRRTHQGQVRILSDRVEIREGHSSNPYMPEALQFEDGWWALVSIRETSPGLAPDTIQALSNPEADPALGNIGPGLSMGEIRMMIESQNGEIWHHTEPGQTTISFALPISINGD
ncbi:MAG: GAF domain-containing protein [Anaerolineales bacterium]|nr:GAF domain-containing protein [Anaerolineales bacterium]